MGASVKTSRDSPKQFIEFMNKARCSHEIRRGGVDAYWGPIDEAIFAPKALVS